MGPKYIKQYFSRLTVNFVVLYHVFVTVLHFNLSVIELICYNIRIQNGYNEKHEKEELGHIYERKVISNASRLSSRGRKWSSTILKVAKFNMAKLKADLSTEHLFRSKKKLALTLYAEIT